MDFDFSFEQQLIAKSVRGTLEELDPVMDRAPRGYTAAELARKLAELGIWGSGDPDEPALGFADAVAVAIEVGRSLPAGPVIEQLAASLVLTAAHRDIVDALSTGKLVTVAVNGRFVRGAGGLEGEVIVPFAGDACAILAPVSGKNDEWAIFRPDELVLSPVETTDITVDAFRAKPGAGSAGTPMVLNDGAGPEEVLALLAMAEVVGAAEIALEKTVGYIRERKQFGKPIGTNQAIKHIAADAAASVEIMKAAVEYAGWTFDQAGEAARDEMRVALLTARSFVGEHARLVLERCTQMYGGIAFTWDFGLHRYLRRILYRTATLIRPMDAREDIAARLLTGSDIAA